MATRAQIGVLILAAGASNRLGRPKAFVRVGNQSLLGLQIAKARRLAPSWLGVVVTPRIRARRHQFYKPNGLNASGHASASPLRWIVNAHPTRGMGHSIAMGVAQAPSNLKALLVLTVDQWAVSVRDLKRLLRLPKLRGAFYADTVGVPAVFPRRLFKRLTTLEGERGAKGLLREATRVAMPNAAFDVDTERDRRVLSRQQTRAMAGLTRG